MGSDDKADASGFDVETALTRLGREPSAYHGFVNTPVFRGSTVLFPDAESLDRARSNIPMAAHPPPRRARSKPRSQSSKGGRGLSSRLPG